MTTVVMARDYRTAAEAARMLALGQDWSYPHDADQLRGIVIPRVVYVEGWLESTALTVEVAEMVQTRLAADATVLLLPRDFATREPERLAAVSAPFVETVAPGLTEDSRTRSRRRGAPPAWLWGIGLLLASAAAGACLSLLADQWGWW